MSLYRLLIYLLGRENQQESHLLLKSARAFHLAQEPADQPPDVRCLDEALRRGAKLPREKSHFHVLKHSIATHLPDADAGQRFLHDRLGHADIQNAVIYAALGSHSRERKAREYFMRLPRL